VSVIVAYPATGYRGQPRAALAPNRIVPTFVRPRPRIVFFPPSVRARRDSSGRSATGRAEPGRDSCWRGCWL